ncbi:UDP-N-acetylglucosamine transferase subunit [Polyrhizophydium stewartii]|uniref:UDP-N-acetylglucosamine transferase subunit ALG14 n=1 Tax=Polyrhizophydium stewartii TaxID=2732419 RepID=A0ABR4MW62_9FUNG
MLRLLAGLGPKPFRPRLYVLAESDTTSEPRIHELERQLGSSSSSSTDYRITRIPRSREVGQSWISTVITTLQAATSSLALLCTDPPDMARLAGIVSTRIVYVESFARVNSLSLSGKILYRIADCFVVQWPQLAARYPKAVFRGRLV